MIAIGVAISLTTIVEDITENVSAVSCLVGRYSLYHDCIAGLTSVADFSHACHCHEVLMKVGAISFRRTCCPSQDECNDFRYFDHCWAVVDIRSRFRRARIHVVAASAMSFAAFKHLHGLG